MVETYGTVESPGWRQARRAGFVQEITAAFRQRPEGLLSFDDISQRLKLGAVEYLDLQDIPLDHIVDQTVKIIQGLYQEINDALEN